MSNRKRRDHRDLNKEGWIILIQAFRAMKGRGEYDAFAEAHDILFFSGIHGEFFLPWHRDFINNMELGLRNNGEFDVALPYWNWESEPKVPTELGKLRERWGLGLPNSSRIEGLTHDSSRKIDDWLQFQNSLGGWTHNRVHNRIGGAMAEKNSPADPFFWLHHGYIDKVWADWQQSDKGKAPVNLEDTMQRSPALQKKVKDVVNISSLDYTYINYSAE